VDGVAPLSATKQGRMATRVVAFDVGRVEPEAEVVGNGIEATLNESPSGSGKRRRLEENELTREVASAVVTRIRCGPRGEAPIASEVRFGIICEGGAGAPPLWAWSAGSLRGTLTWVCATRSVTPSFKRTVDATSDSMV
jgi:hypothetical protein